MQWYRCLFWNSGSRSVFFLHERVDRLQVLDLSEDQLSDQSRWEVAVGRALLLCHTHQTDSALAEVNEGRTHLANLLGPAGLESYERAHPLIVKMHMLWDLQTVGCECLALDSKGNRVRNRDNIRESLLRAIKRAECTGVGMVAHVEMLSLLRALARLHGFQDIVASTWKKQAKVCFESQHAQAAWAGVLEAESVGCKDAFKLKGKLLWQAARHLEAVDVMQCGIGALQATVGVDTPHVDATNKTLARAKLQLLSWQVSQGQGATDVLKKDFMELLKLSPQDDKIHLEFANFLRSVYENLRTRCFPLCFLSLAVCCMQPCFGCCALLSARCLCLASGLNAAPCKRNKIEV
jgi:serine/threonine-protein kinase ATR